MVGVSKSPTTRGNSSTTNDITTNNNNSSNGNGLISSDCCFCFMDMDDSFSMLNLFWSTGTGDNDDQEEVHVGGPLDTYHHNHNHGHDRNEQRQTSSSSSTMRGIDVNVDVNVNVNNRNRNMSLRHCKSLDDIDSRMPYPYQGQRETTKRRIYKSRNNFLSKYRCGPGGSGDGGATSTSCSSSKFNVNNVAPPPVIALSRSSFSTSSDTSTSSSLADTEVDGDHVYKYQLSSSSSCMNHHHKYGYRKSKGKNKQKHKRRGGGGRGRTRKHEHENGRDYDDTEEFFLSKSKSSYEISYAGRHEQLINSLFEDAKRRNEQKMHDEILAEQQQQQQQQQLQQQDINLNVCDNLPPSYHTPPRPKRNNANSSSYSIGNSNNSNSNGSGHAQVQIPSSDKSVASRGSKYSRTSNSSSSELLTPSSHKFQYSLKEPRRLPRFRRLNYFARMNISRNGNGNGNDNRSGGGGGGGKTRKERHSRHNTHSQKQHHSTKSPLQKKHCSYSNHQQHYSPHQSDFSSCESKTTTSPYPSPSPSPSPNPANVQTFLDRNVQLQKDSGRGVEIGSNISANGLDAALQKLNDKMDLLAEVERDGRERGRWSHAAAPTLTRVPAREMNDDWREEAGVDLLNLDQGNDGKGKGGNGKGYVETRSMLAVKLGFVSLKYGVLVRWNVETELAELILLRKACPESFMKITCGSKKKGKGAIRKEDRDKERIHGDEEDYNHGSLHGASTPSFSTASSENSFYDSLALDPVASAHF